VNKRLGQTQKDPLGNFTDLGDIRIYWDRQEATHGKERIPLTTKEIGLLRLFVENKGRLLTRNMILERVWSDTYITDRTIDSHVKELRKKIPPMVKLLKTIYGSGYRLDL
jgi:DNA-binding response OmpR family regulator